MPAPDKGGWKMKKGQTWRLMGTLSLLAWGLGLWSGHSQERSLPLQLIRLPAGFSISVYADRVPGARSMTRSPRGILYVGTRMDRVYAVVDRDGDFRADRVYTIASGLNVPNGVAWKDGSLYVAEIHRILRFDGIDDRLDDPPPPVVVRDDYPRDRHHGWKFIRFGPDGWLYVPVGAPCNVCERPDPYATITRMKPDGSRVEVIARGVRNTVGFDWHPVTGELWFTDNGRDWLGDDRPPDELNRLGRFGLHFGFPYCHGRNLSDPEWGEKRKCEEFTPPVVELGPHVAALGMRFYTGTMFPPEYRHQIFIAEHGSWNRSVPIGYRITVVRLSTPTRPGGQASREPGSPPPPEAYRASYEVFAEGWLQGTQPWGRPVDLEVLPDGSLLVSDDFAGVIYRITYRGR